MSKGKRYTLLIFSVSFAVIFGGWFFTREMLEREEAIILTAKGEIPIKVAEDDIEESSLETGKFEGVALTEAEMAEILTVWNTGGGEIFHEPMAGQMNMEQAILTGRKWINRLAEKNILPEHLSDCSFVDTIAVLCSLDSSSSLQENYISYWKVTYVEEDIQIVLTIHALSGQVWKAEITMNGDKILYGTCSDEEILAAAFPFLKNENVKIKEDNSAIYKITEGKIIYAVLKRDSIWVKKEEPKARLFLGIGVAAELEIQEKI